MRLAFFRYHNSPPTVSCSSPEEFRACKTRRAALSLGETNERLHQARDGTESHRGEPAPEKKPPS